MGLGSYLKDIFLYHFMYLNIPYAKLNCLVKFNSYTDVDVVRPMPNFQEVFRILAKNLDFIEYVCQLSSGTVHIKGSTYSAVALSMLKGTLPDTNSESTSKEHVQQFLHLSKNSKLLCLLDKKNNI